MQNTFGNFLRKIRKERKFSLREVERKANISNAYLSQIERGLRGIPTLVFLHRLALVYGIDVNLLIKKALEVIMDTDLERLNEKHKRMDISRGGLQIRVKVPNPSDYFILESYNLLTDSGKKQLYKFLQFLLENESKS